MANRVVLAEDNYIAREGIGQLLGSGGDDRGRAVVRRPGLAARRGRERAPDVVVTDIRMPPTDTDEGIRAAAELRETHPRSASWC